MTVFDKKKKKTRKRKTPRVNTRFAFRETHFNLPIRFLFGRPGAVKVSNWFFLGKKGKKKNFFFFLFSFFFFFFKKKKKDNLSSKSYTLT